MKIVIIGGGVSGLSAAFRLTELKKEGKFAGDFVLLEAADRLGGIVKTVKRDGFLLEAGPDAFLSEKPEALELAKKLGIENELLPTNDENRRSFLVRENKLCPVPEGFHLIAPSNLEAFFKSEILSLHGKTRLANERFLPPVPPKDDESLADFVRRRFGEEALTRLAQPMIGGIYTADPEKLSLRATQPRFLELEQQFGSVIRGLQEKSKTPNPKSPNGVSGARYSLFLSFKRGMQTLIDALEKQIPEDAIHLGTSVKTLRFDEFQRLWEVETEQKTFEADGVILALPAHKAANLLKNQFPALSNELTEIEYASTATVNFAFRRDQIPHPLNGFGFVVPFIERRTLMACTFSSVKFAERAPENSVLLRAFVGGALQPDMFDLQDDEMISGVLNDLRDLLGLKGEPIFSEITRWHRSMPQYWVGHLEKARKIKSCLASIPSLQLATTAIDGVGLPDSVRHGNQAAENLLAFELTK
ncbi:MAG: protoporphyrinogen oxidase [Acidobacteriota bacterium]|nr:protoporphyrinogen oxidase [Acidobacteriota bacterium]